jgi:putative restriction endonuclease
MKKTGEDWTRDELILAINLYCKIPFGKIHDRNPDIIELANIIGRTPGAVGWKLANFASIDPSLPQKGASNVSKLDRIVWKEFFESWEEMAFTSEDLLAKKENLTLQKKFDFVEKMENKKGEEHVSLVKTRVNQNFFRQMILASYDNSCCITGISIPELLNASHIIPWTQDPKNRLNPRNGICLNALHDRAFDRGLITIGEDWRVIVSPKLLTHSNKTNNLGLITRFNNKKIKLPLRFLPDLTFIEYHRENIYQS